MKKQNTSWPEKKREEWHGKQPEFINIDMTRSEIYKDLVNSFITWKHPLQDKLSILDLPKLHTITDNEKFHLLSVFFSSHDQRTDDIYFDRKNNLVTPSWINYINQLLNDAVDYYQDYLLRSIWQAFIQKRNKKKSNPPKISLKDTKDVLDFIEATTAEKNSRADRQIDCSLLKIAVWLHDYKKNEKELSDAENKFKEAKQKYFFPYFYDTKWQDINSDEIWNYDYVQLKTRSAISNKPTIFFRSSRRIKDPKKIVLKTLAIRSYESVDALHDIYGIRNEVKDVEDGLFLLEYLRKNVFAWDCDIVDKRFFSDDILLNIDFLNKHKESLDPNFYQYLHDLFDHYKETWKYNKLQKNNKEYRDIKIRWKIWWKKTEIQINLVNSKNEKWYSHHLIYDAKTKISVIARLQSYVPESIIYRYIFEAIEKNIQEDTLAWRKPELLVLWWYRWDGKNISQEEKQSAAKKIFDNLLENEKAFIKLDLPGKQHSAIYTTVDHRNANHQDDNYKKIYPDGAQIQFAWEWTNKKI